VFRRTQTLSASLIRNVLSQNGVPHNGTVKSVLSVAATRTEFTSLLNEVIALIVAIALGTQVAVLNGIAKLATPDNAMSKVTAVT